MSSSLVAGQGASSSFDANSSVQYIMIFTIYKFSIFDLQIFDFQFSIFNSRFSILDFQFSILYSQFLILNFSCFEAAKVVIIFLLSSFLSCFFINADVKIYYNGENEQKTTKITHGVRWFGFRAFF